MMRAVYPVFAAAALVAVPALAQETDQPAPRASESPSDDCEVFGVVGMSIMAQWQNGMTHDEIVEYWSRFEGELGDRVLLIVNEAVKIERIEDRADRAQASAEFRDIVKTSCQTGRQNAASDRESVG